ncbi:MAG: DUF4038 domain-containing protein [Eubacteriales bacterium]|nr:DUF4038 domain-containing protein [Eubacteriales bacterium]
MCEIMQYEIFEKELKCLEENSPLAGEAVFCHEKGECYSVSLFQKEPGKYAVRFMPHLTGKWNYKIELHGIEFEGTFLCREAEGENHGRVITHGFHFRYEDGHRYIPFGTTAYAWVNQTEELQNETIETLSKEAFNKIRMCVFPKSMPYNQNEPAYFPFAKKAGETDHSWDVHAIIPEFWYNLDKRLLQLRDLGIEADLIVFHPYDRWGFAEMPREDCVYYLRYLMARYGAYRNLWWSLANEYEMLMTKTKEDWDTFGEVLHKEDIYHHLISIHQIVQNYPKRDWMTHMSIQTGDINHIIFWKQEYQIPVIIDECGYEGDLEFNWGNLSAEEMTHRVWWSLCRGGFCTHGETYHRDDEVLWWAKGGKLYGKSPKQIAFAKSILYEIPQDYREIISNIADPNQEKQQQNDETITRFIKLIREAKPNEYWVVTSNLTPMALEGENFYLEYLDRNCPGRKTLNLSEKHNYTVEVLDIREMTRTTVLENVSGTVTVPLPGKEGQVIYAHE